MYERSMTHAIRGRLSEKRRFIQVILGPRQVGKTTAIQQVLKAIEVPSHYAAADLPAVPQPAGSPEGARQDPGGRRTRGLAGHRGDRNLPQVA